MKLAIFNDFRLGLLVDDESTIVDVTAAMAADDRDPLTAGWWRRLCRDHRSTLPALRDAARSGTRIPLSGIRLRAPVLGPTKIIACAVNYRDHVAEMRDMVLERTRSDQSSWMLDFDIFLKAPSSIIGTGDPILLPPDPLSKGQEIHHECELAFVIGEGGSNIPAENAFDHIFGYTIALDMTVRGQGDRSRRKSYDTFTPIGPWLTTSDEIADPHALSIELTVNGEIRQKVMTSELLVDIPNIVAYASRIMRLEPGDVVLTGAPAGVGQVFAGDLLYATIGGLGALTNTVDVAMAHPAATFE